ncbi:MAG: class I SAM-dependent methyltransferase [candidate division Zixibacteria bacterium]|nr:class I SAM-dependent methyltransferase [candidate division Zixibacteria bacterium]
MSNTDPFERFAAISDLDPRNESLRKHFFQEVFRKHGVKAVLDCACGTGSDLILVHGLGMQVRGSDISDAMLQQAREKLGRNNLKIPLVKADFSELPRYFDRPFDAVLCLTTSLPQVLTEDNVRRALGSMREVLAPKGILVLNQGMSDRQWHDRVRFHPVVSTADHTRIIVVDYYESEWEAHVLDVFHGEGSPGFYVNSFRYLKMLEDDYVRLLDEVHFRDVHVYGGFDMRPYNKKETSSLVIVAGR